MTDIEHKRNKVEKLEAGNERSFNELCEKSGGRFTMNTSDLRRELFIEHMVKIGAITEEQKLDFDLEFHEKVEEALNSAWSQYREAENQQKLSVVQKSNKLVDKSGRPLK